MPLAMLVSRDQPDWDLLRSLLVNLGEDDLVMADVPGAQVGAEEALADLLAAVTTLEHHYAAARERGEPLVGEGAGKEVKRALEALHPAAFLDLVHLEIERR